jgi:hypothetical protein
MDEDSEDELALDYQDTRPRGLNVVGESFKEEV